jgi:hypothetical protein
VKLTTSFLLRGAFEKFVASLRVGTSWRCGDGLFFEVPPLASDALLTTLHLLLENVLHTVCRKLQKDSGTGSSDLLITSKFPPLENRRSSHCIVSIDLMDEL